MALALKTATTATTPRLQAPQRPASTMVLKLVAPKTAQAILEKQRYPGQRPLRAHHVAHFAQLMALGHFVQGTVVTFAAVGAAEHGWTKAQTYLEDGYHRLAATVQRGGRGQWFWHLTRYVGSMDEVRAVYRSIDRGLMRTMHDLYGAEAAQDPQGWPRTHFRLLGPAVLPLAAGFAQESGFDPLAVRTLLRDSDLRFAMMATWRPEFQDALAAMHGSPKSVRDELLKASPLSIMLVTYRFQPLHARTFWSAVAKDSGLVEGTPPHALLRYLREHQVHKVGPALFQRHIAAAWNAHMAGAPLKQVRTRLTAADAIELAGTPHDGTVVKRYLLPDGQVVQTPQAVDHV